VAGLVSIVAGLATNAGLVKAHGGMAVTPTDPEQLYVPEDSPHLVDMVREGQMLHLQVKGIHPDPLRVREVGFEMSEGAHTTTVSLPGDGGAVRLEYELYGEELLLRSSSAPFTTSPLRSVSYWTEGALEGADPAAVAEAREALRRLFEASPPTSELDKLVRVYDHVQQELGGKWGAPDPESKGLDGLSMLALARAGSLRVDCGPSSIILAAYANLAGLPTRVVSLAGRRGDAVVGRHTVTETWLADRRQWVMSDMVNAVRYFTSPEGQPLSLVEAMDAWRTAHKRGLTPVMGEKEGAIDPYWGPTHYFLDSVVLHYLRPKHYLARTKLDRLWVGFTSPKPAWTRNEKQLRQLGVYHGLGQLLVIIGVAMLLAAGRGAFVARRSRAEPPAPA